MGYNTVISICNDNLSDYEKRPDRFLRTIRDGVNDGEEFWGITVLPSEHADNTQIVAVGQNSATKLFSGWRGRHHEHMGQIILLRDWADSLGFDLVERSK